MHLFPAVMFFYDIGVSFMISMVVSLILVFVLYIIAIIIILNCHAGRTINDLANGSLSEQCFASIHDILMYEIITDPGDYTMHLAV